MRWSSLGLSFMPVLVAAMRVDHVHTLDDLAEGGILAVQMSAAVGTHDEELAAGGVGGLGAGHGQHAAVVAAWSILHAVGGELALDAVAGAADAGALGVSRPGS